MKFLVFSLFFCWFLNSISADADWKCQDVLTIPNRCRKYKIKQFCNLQSVARACQQTCELCDAGWTRWSSWSDCNAEDCGLAGQRERVRTCSSLSPNLCRGSYVIVQQCTRANCSGSTQSGKICKNDTFLCPGTKEEKDCIPKQFICDGKSDCIDGADEEDCLFEGGPPDAFIIAMTTGYFSCLYVRKNSKVLGAWHCPLTDQAPFYQFFKWKWSWKHHLRNIGNGECLAKVATSEEVITETCDPDSSNQKWECTSNNQFPDFALNLIDRQIRYRFAVMENKQTRLIKTAMLTHVGWHLHGDNRTSICSKKLTWKPWSSWSECSDDCVRLGTGLRTRNRICNGGVMGKGGCTLPFTEEQECFSSACKPQCPKGFDNSTYAFACFKLFYEEAMNHTDAQNYCESLEDSGVSLKAKLASDKDKNSHETFLRLMSKQNVTESYIGVFALSIDGVKIVLNYSNDGNPVGNLQYSRQWHDIELNIITGLSDEKGSQFQIQSFSGKCLEVNETNFEVVPTACSFDRTIWRYLFNFLINKYTGLCLSRTNVQDGKVKFIGEKCDLQEPSENILWKLERNYIKPFDGNQLLSIKNTTLVFYESIYNKWFADTIYNGPTLLSTTRDWQGLWFNIFMFSFDLCVGLHEDNQLNILVLLMVSCNSESTSQRWSWLWKTHIYNRHYSKCLTLASSKPGMPKIVKNNTKVYVEECREENKFQMWKKFEKHAEQSEGISILTASENPKFSLTRNCSDKHSTQQGDDDLCVNDRENYLRLLDNSKQPKVEELFMLKNIGYSDNNTCLQANEVSVNGSSLHFANCSENKVDGGWWRWHGVNLINNLNTDALYCLTAVDFVEVMIKPCDNSSDQMWNTMGQGRGSHIVMFYKNAYLISLDENRTVVLRNFNDSQWKVVDMIEKSAIMPIMRECWNKGNYNGIRSWTESGLNCQPWKKQWPHPHNYPLNNGPFCRNPASFRPSDIKPWCLTEDPETVWEVCEVSSCPTYLPTILTKNGTWLISQGAGKRAFFCESPAECVNGPGFDYNGTVGRSDSGKLCLNWFKRINIIGLSNSGIIAPNHTFCRNPNKDVKGPWCWVDKYVKEYCSNILQCPIMCPEPPQLFRGHFLAILHEAPGLGYANNAKVIYKCNIGHYRSVYENTSFYDIKCVNGEWEGIVPHCEVMKCEVPTTGVGNATPVNKYAVILYNNTITYSCDSGYMLMSGMVEIKFFCNGKNRWKTVVPIPSRYSHLDSQNLKEFWPISCLAACNVGYTPMSHWCMQMITASDNELVHTDSLTCEDKTDILPIEAAQDPDIQAMLRNLVKTQVQVNVERVNQPETLNASVYDKSVYRSLMNALYLQEGKDYAANRFHIATNNSLIINSTSSNDTTQYCLGTFTSTDLKFVECEYWNNSLLYFRWISTAHLLHIESKLCLTGSGSNVILGTCDISSIWQKWQCVNNSLVIINGASTHKMYVDKSVDLKPMLSTAPVVGNVETYSEIFYAGNSVVSGIGENRINLCASLYRPVNSIIKMGCNGNSYFVDIENCSLDPTISCATDQVKLIQNLKWKELLKTSITNEISCTCTWTEVPTGICSTASSSNITTTASPNCTTTELSGLTCPVSGSTVKLGSWCVMLQYSDDGNFSQVIETPCDSPVTGKICVKKSRFICPKPVSLIHNGFRLKPGFTKKLNHSINQTPLVGSPTGYSFGAVVTYECDDGFMFSDGFENKQTECLSGGTWSLDPRVLECVPNYCQKPNGVVFAEPFAINMVNLSVGTELVVSCMQGYMVREGVFSQISVCANGGYWAPPLAKCTSLICPKPPTIPGMEVFGNSNMLNSVVTYKCQYGYHLILSDGQTAERSEHRCDSSAQWLPSPLLLRCESIVCGNVQNVLESKGFGIGQVLTLGCLYGDSLYNGTQILKGNLTAVCDPHGNWYPILNNLKCGKTPCMEPEDNMNNSKYIKWTNENAGIKDKPIYKAKAEYFCDDGFYVLHTFRIFISSHSDKGCLAVDSITEKLIHDSNSRCNTGGDSKLLWQWHPEDSNLLRQVTTGLCLTSPLDTWNIASQGYGNVSLEECIPGDKRQSWICQSGSGFVNLVALMEESDFGDIAYLHYDPLNGGAIITTALQNELADWSLNDGSMICLLKKADRTFYQKCSRYGKWVPGTNNVACHPTTCKIPSTTPNILFQQFLNPFPFTEGMHIKFGESLYASCKNGLMNILGKTTIKIKCSNMRTWTPSINSLKCEPIKCPSLYNMTDIYIVKGDKIWSYLSEVQLKCVEGKWFGDIKQPSRWVVCGRDGTWSVPPYKLKCSPLQCPDQQSIPFSLKNQENETGNSFNDYRTIRCQNHYWIERDLFETIVRCNSHGKWLPDVKCKPVTCPPPPYVQYATLLDLTNSNWVSSQTVRYTCSQYRFVNNKSSVSVSCKKNGRWSPDPSTLSCFSPGCIPLRELLNIQTGISDEYSNIGSKVNVTCSEGYVMMDGKTTSIATCRTDRKWFPPTSYLNCQPIFCGNLPSQVDHGTWKVNEGYTYRSTATMTCDEAYFLPNFNAQTFITAQCDIKQQWKPDPETITCTSIRCYEPLPKPNTIFTALHNKTYAEWGDKASYVCTEGYWFSSLIYEYSLTCNSSGLWYPDPFSIHCVPIVCNDPGFILYSTRKVVTSINQSQVVESFSYRNLLEYKCFDGYWIGDGITRQRTMCEKTGDWSISVGNMRPCKPVTCSILPTVLHADIVAILNDIHGAHGLGVKITYKCREGWWFFGRKIINSTIGSFGNETLQVKTQYVECTEQGEWNPDPNQLQCSQKSCPELPGIHINDSASVVFGSKIKVSCPGGYFIAGSAKKSIELTCNEMGEWDGLPYKDKVCEILRCGEPRMILNGKFTVLTDTKINDQAIYHCDPGYSISKSAKTQLVKCSSSLNWEPSNFQCVEDTDLVCDLPPDVELATRFLPSRYTATEEVVYYCDDHYWMAEDQFRLSVTCGANGMWSPDPLNIVCYPVTCLNPETPSNSIKVIYSGNISTSESNYRSRIELIYLCHDGFWVEGKYAMLKTICQKTGKWLPEPPFPPCVSTFCPRLPNIQHSIYDFEVNSLGNLEAKYTCKTGYIFYLSLLVRTQNFTTSCIDQKWVPSPYQRKCDPLICEEPYILTNGYFNLGSIYHGATITYYCQPGYKFTDSSDLKKSKCDSSGDWNPDPKTFGCQAIDCGPPIYIRNTTLQVEETTYMSVATYKCSDGLIMEGSQSLYADSICAADRRWTSSPPNIARCIEVVCQSSPPTFDHVSHSSGTKHYGYAWTYYCKPGFYVEKLVKKFKVYCKSDGQWSHPTGKCVPSSCGAPAPILNAKLTNYTRTIYDSTRIVETANYECNHGFWLSDGVRKAFSVDLQCVDGIWSPLISNVRCVDVTCDVLPDLHKSTTNTTRSHIKNNPVFGSNIQYSCSYGYFFKELQKRNITVFCQANGFWSMEVRNLKCEKTFCSRTYNDPNAVWSHFSLFDIGSKAKLTCFPMHWLERGLDSITLICDENGVWSPPSKCMTMACPTPEVEHSWYNVSGSTHIQFPVTSTVQIYCLDGYYLSISVEYLVCELSGEWNPSHRTVKCEPVNCIAPTLISDNAQLSGATDFNSTLTLRCDEGFMISPGFVEIKSTCQADTTWSTDLSNYTCVPIQCRHSGVIENGTIVSTSNPPLYKHREVVRLSCLQGFWVDRNIRQFSTKCGDQATWEPSIDNITCDPVTCPEAKEKNFAVRSSSERLVGIKVTYQCDPIHWLSETKDGKLTLLSRKRITITCLEGGDWDIDPEIISCSSVSSLDKLPVTPTTDKVVASGPFKWLSGAIINGPGDGTEVGEWIDRAENGFLGRSLSHHEIEDSLAHEKYNSFFQELSEIVANISCCNITVINGTVYDANSIMTSSIQDSYNVSLINQTLNDTLIYDYNGKLFLKPDDNASYEYIESYSYVFSPEVLNFIENDVEFEENIAKNETTMNTNYAPTIKNLLKLKNFTTTARNAILNQAFATRKIILPRSSEFPLELSHDEAVIWDGDPLTGWTPSPHAISYQIEFHLGSLHLVDQIMLMGTNIKFNLSFYPDDQSLKSTHHGPITIRKTQLETGCTCMQVSVESSTYGPIIVISDFGEQPATIVHFSFDLPPIIREISYRAAPAQWLQVVSVYILFLFLIVLTTIFVVVIPILFVLDHRILKENNVMWFGGVQDGDGLPCILQINTKKPFRTPMDVYICVKTQQFSPVAWFNKALYGRQTLGFFVHEPVGPDIQLYIACSPSTNHKVVKRNIKPWEISGIKAWCGGKKWIWAKNKRNCFVKSNQRYQFNLRRQKQRKGENILVRFIRVHVLSFLMPFHSIRCREYFTLLQRLVSISTCVTIAFLTFVMINVFRYEISTTLWFDASLFKISKDSLICLSISSALGLLLLLMLRFSFVGLSQKQRRRNLMGKTRMAVLSLPGVSLYNLIMTGRYKPKQSADGSKVKKTFLSRLFPTNSILVAWRKERRDNQHHVDKSKSIPGALYPSAAPKLNDDLSSESLSTEVDSELDKKASYLKKDTSLESSKSKTMSSKSVEIKSEISSSISNSLADRLNFSKPTKFVFKKQLPSEISLSTDVSSIPTALMSTDSSSTLVDESSLEVTLRKSLTVARSPSEGPTSPSKPSKLPEKITSLPLTVDTMFTSDQSTSISSDVSTLKNTSIKAKKQPDFLTKKKLTTESSDLLTSSDITSGSNLSTIKGGKPRTIATSSKLSSDLKTTSDSTLPTSSLLTSLPTSSDITQTLSTLKKMSSPAPESSLTKPSCCSETTTTTDTSRTTIEPQPTCVDCKDIKWNTDEVFRTCLESKEMVANGRRTIFPTSSHIKDIRQPTLITLLITLLIIFSLGATAFAYYLVANNNTGPNAMFLYHGAFLAIILAIAVVSFLEALVIILLSYFKLINPTINLEKEPDVLILEHKKKQDAECALMERNSYLNNNTSSCNISRPRVATKNMAVQVDCRRKAANRDNDMSRQALIQLPRLESPKRVRSDVLSRLPKSTSVQVDMPNIIPSHDSSSMFAESASPGKSVTPSRVPSEKYWDAKDNEHLNAVQVADWLTYNQFPYVSNNRPNLASQQHEDENFDKPRTLMRTESPKPPLYQPKAFATSRNKPQTLISSQRSLQVDKGKGLGKKSLKVSDDHQLSDGETWVKTSRKTLKTKSNENVMNSLRFPETKPIYDLRPNIETDFHEKEINSRSNITPSSSFGNAVVLVSERFGSNTEMTALNDQISSSQYDDSVSGNNNDMTISFPDNRIQTYTDNSLLHRENLNSQYENPAENIIEKGIVLKDDNDGNLKMMENIDNDDTIFYDTTSDTTSETVINNDKEYSSFPVYLTPSQIDYHLPAKLESDTASVKSNISFKTLSEPGVGVFYDDSHTREDSDSSSKESENFNKISESHFADPLYAMSSDLKVSDDSDFVPDSDTSSLGIDSAISMTTDSSQLLRFPKAQIKVYSRSSLVNEPISEMLQQNNENALFDFDTETSSSRSLTTVYEAPRKKIPEQMEGSQVKYLSDQEAMQELQDMFSTKTSSHDSFDYDQAIVGSTEPQFQEDSNVHNLLQSEKPSTSRYADSNDTPSSKISLLSSTSEPDLEQSTYISVRSQQHVTDNNIYDDLSVLSEGDSFIYKIADQPTRATVSVKSYSDNSSQQSADGVFMIQPNQAQSTVVTVRSLSSIPSLNDKSFTTEGDLKDESLAETDLEQSLKAAETYQEPPIHFLNEYDEKSLEGGVASDYSLGTEPSKISEDSAETSKPQSSRETLADIHALREMFADIKDTFQQEMKGQESD